MEKSKFIHKQNLLLIIIFLFIFIIGVSVGHFKYYPFAYIKQLKALLFSNSHQSYVSNLEVCELPVVNRFLENSHVFIGHAYGAPGAQKKDKKTDYLAPNVLNFIQNYKHQLKSLTFTGDLFSVPSLAKWKRLSKELSQTQKILIAPGNHDVERPDSRDVFNLSFYGSRVYPFVENLDGVPVVYDDSVHSKWLISKETLDIVNTLSSKNVIIARHNVPAIDMLHLANSTAGISKDLQHVEDLVKGFNINVNYTWVIGDSGAFSSLPRVTCVRFLNHIFIVNGVGEIKGDSVVIFKNGKFYQYEL